MQWMSPPAGLKTSASPQKSDASQIHFRLELERFNAMARGGRSQSSAAGERLSSTSITSEPSWLTISQLCRRWQLGRKTVYKFIDAGILPAWRVGTHLYRVAVADVLRFEARNRMRSK
jgi:excisionase family DNA binding protein